MKALYLFLALICAVAFGASTGSSSATATALSQKESAIVEFTNPVKLLDVTLKGRYLIVHDDEMMAKGEACTFVYSLKEGMREVVSFHCTPVERAKARKFTIRSAPSSTDPSIAEVREIQFAGSTESHMVPTRAMEEDARVNLVP